MENKQYLSLYLDTTLVEKMEQRAAKKDWSRNKWIEHALIRATREKKVNPNREVS